MTDAPWVDTLPTECSCYKLAPGILEFGQHHRACINACACCGTTDNLMWRKGDHELAVTTICRPCKFGACEECR